MIGVICPSIFEYKALNRRELARSGVTLVKSGMGKLRAFNACADLAKSKKPDWILLIGFAGALTTDLRIGDIVEPAVFVEQDYYAEPFEKFPNQIRNRAKLLKDSLPAVMLTQDRFLTENPYKGRGHGYRHLACDMESYAVAYYCKSHGVRYSVVKLISDVADATADHDFLKACRELSPKLNETVLRAVKMIGGKK